jgi:hypothetical protein
MWIGPARGGCPARHVPPLRDGVPAAEQTSARLDFLRGPHGTCPCWMPAAPKDLAGPRSTAAPRRKRARGSPREKARPRAGESRSFGRRHRIAHGMDDAAPPSGNRSRGRGGTTGCRPVCTNGFSLPRPVCGGGPGRWRAPRARRGRPRGLRSLSAPLPSPRAVCAGRGRGRGPRSAPSTRLPSHPPLSHFRTLALAVPCEPSPSPRSSPSR